MTVATHSPYAAGCAPTAEQPAQAPKRAVTATLAAAIVTVMLACIAIVGAPSASAEAPSRLQTQITDSAGVLGGDTAAVEQRLSELRSTDDVQLWVTYVDSFDGMPAEQWAQQTARMSDLGTSDALLVVAVQDRGYWFEYTDQQNDQKIADKDIEPRLAVNDWSGAAIGAADGLESSGSGSGLSLGALLGIIVAIIALVGAVLLFTRRRRQKRTAGQAESARDIPGDDTARMSALDIDVLDARARDGLLDASQVVDQSASALDTATDEFGELRTRPFREALDSAKAEIFAAHSLVQRLDDNIPETPTQRKGMLLDVAARAERAKRGLADQSEAFSQMRDLLINGAASVDALTQRAVTLRSQIPAAEQTMAELKSQFTPAVLTSIEDNLPLAAELLDAAEADTARARAALARPVGEQAEAVDAIMTAESELTHAEKLVDGVDHAADDIATARRDLGDLVTEVEEELATAARLLGSVDVSDATSADLTTAAQAGRAAVNEAQRNGESDPLGTFSRLVDVDRDLDEALAAAGNEAKTAGRARAARQAALTRARGAVREADTFISSRSYVIGQTARTRLASAKDTLEAAEATVGPAAFPTADRALSLAREALRLAQDDARRPQNSRNYGGRGGYGRGGRSSTGSMVGGMVAGALIQGMLRGGGGGFGGGGFGGGGFGGGGFGGGGGGGFGGGGAGGRF